MRSNKNCEERREPRFQSCIQSQDGTFYRVIKKNCWWTCIFDTGTPQFLYWDDKFERFEVGSIGACMRNGKWLFSAEEINQMRKDYNLNDEFIIEEAKRVKNDD